MLEGGVCGIYFLLGSKLFEIALTMLTWCPTGGSIVAVCLAYMIELLHFGDDHITRTCHTDPECNYVILN